MLCGLIREMAFLSNLRVISIYNFSFVDKLKEHYIKIQKLLRKLNMKGGYAYIYLLDKHSNKLYYYITKRNNLLKDKDKLIKEILEKGTIINISNEQMLKLLNCIDEALSLLRHHSEYNLIFNCVGLEFNKNKRYTLLSFDILEEDNLPHFSDHYSNKLIIKFRNKPILSISSFDKLDFDTIELICF